MTQYNSAEETAHTHTQSSQAIRNVKAFSVVEFLNYSNGKSKLKMFKVSVYPKDYK